MDDEPKTRVLETPTPGPPVRAAIMQRRRIGPYELVRRVAHGGMATVYLGRHIGAAGFEKVVALKVIHPHLADEPEFLGMFLDEARIAARLHHPHVVEILNLGVEDETHYMVMEYVEGSTLSALVRAHEHRLPLAVSLRILADALEGLAAAHELVDRDGRPYDLVHRDISPQNLLITLDGRVKVTDFGIMKAAGRHARTRTGELRGKVAYMSPEHASDNRTDARSDVFALGVIAWELVMGARLFAEDTDAATLKRVIACDVPPLRDEVFAEVEPAVAETIRALVDRALAADPEARYPSARAMLGDVRDTLRSVAPREDPREHLATLMDEHFAERAAYLRAALRDRGPTPIGDPASAGLDVAAVEAREEDTPNDAGGSVTTTVTTTAGGGRRAWVPWVVLPIVGAAIAVAVMQLVPTVTSGPAAPVAGERPSAEPRRVHWYISTDPEGASVIVDGTPHDGLTPTEVVVAAGPPVTLVIEKAGMRPTKAVLRPMNDDNLFYRLVPQAGVPANPNPEPGATTGAAARVEDPGTTDAPRNDHSTTLRQSPRVKSKAGKRRAGEPDPAAAAEPGFKPMPDFDSPSEGR